MIKRTGDDSVAYGQQIKEQHKSPGNRRIAKL